MGRNAQLTATTVDVLLRGARVWLHVRSYEAGRHTTIPDHMPKAHRAHLEWSPTRLIQWGATIGRHTEALVHAILESRPHPEQGYYRSCLGILRLAKQHGSERLEAACARARAAGARSYARAREVGEREAHDPSAVTAARFSKGGMRSNWSSQEAEC